ncbi:MAG: hypothetical protein MAG581_01302 [Deltaproteobacteria bacterium]|jgi:hypothetical protein|nr:hypothetical protein [Deltaproteobacteria bacterium]
MNNYIYNQYRITILYDYLYILSIIYKVLNNYIYYHKTENRLMNIYIVMQ